MRILCIVEDRFVYAVSVIDDPERDLIHIGEMAQKLGYRALIVESISLSDARKRLEADLQAEADL